MSNRRTLLGAAGSALFASVAGCASIVERAADGSGTRTTEPSTTGATRSTTAERNVSGRNVSESVDSTTETESLGRITIDPPEVSIPESLVPDDPGQYEYARLGDEEASVTATLYGNWKCPYTREFVLQMFDDVIEEFVKPEDVAVEFRALSYLDDEPFLGDDAPRAARAGLDVWRSAPERYWPYFASVFTNQPPEDYEWATAERLTRFAEATEVGDTDAIEKAILTGEHREAVEATTERADERGIATVPRIAIDEQVTAPTVDFEATRRQLRRAVDD